MHNLFKLKDLLKIVISREQESYCIYNKIIEKTCSTEVKHFLQDLLKEKKKHEEFYANMLQKVSEVKKKTEAVLVEDDAYISELLKSGMNIAQPSNEEISDVDATIIYIVNLDKNALYFFRKLKQYMTPEAHAVVEKAFQEENRHFMADMIAAINSAIRRERNSLSLYMFLQDHVNKAQRKEIGILLREIGRHIEKLLKVKTTLRAQ